MNLRDWLDPSRLYNPATPAGRLTFLWGFTVYPSIILLAVAALTVLVAGVDPDSELPPLVSSA